MSSYTFFFPGPLRTTTLQVRMITVSYSPWFVGLLCSCEWLTYAVSIPPFVDMFQSWLSLLLYVPTDFPAVSGVIYVHHINHPRLDGSSNYFNSYHRCYHAPCCLNYPCWSPCMYFSGKGAHICLILRIRCFGDTFIDGFQSCNNLISVATRGLQMDE